MCKKNLILKCLAPDFTAHGGFQWPSGVGAMVTAPDWEPTEECGKGLHGWMNGSGNINVSDHWSNPDAKWMVLKPIGKVIDLGGKVKFKSCKIVFIGQRHECANLIAEQGCAGVHFVSLTGGDDSTLTGGYRSTLTGGYRSTLTGGDYSTLTGGDYSTLTGGDYSTLTGGDYSTLTGGDYSTLTGGNYSTLTGGDYSTLTGGDYSTLTGGPGSTLTGGDYSTLLIRYFDCRLRTAIAYVGENGIKAAVPYRLNEYYEFEEVQS